MGDPGKNSAAVQVQRQSSAGRIHSSGGGAGGGGQVAFPLMASTDQISSTHVMEGNRLNSIYSFKC